MKNTYRLLLAPIVPYYAVAQLERLIGLPLIMVHAVLDIESGFNMLLITGCNSTRTWRSRGKYD